MDPASIALWTIAAIWASAAVVFTIVPWGILRLPNRMGAETRPEGRVSVIVCARNEAARITATVERLLDQLGERDEVIVVDDRSEDATAALLAGIAASDARLRITRVDRLPEGWIGKSHAAWNGAQMATGEWLLFTDGDAWFAPGVVTRAVGAAEAECAHHVCLIPGEIRQTTASRAAMIGLYFGFGFAAAAANRDLWWGPIGVGAFNLVRSEAYRAVGGHEAIRLEIVEDARLGGNLLRAGFRTRVYDGHHELEVEWGGSLRGIVTALRKNLFAAMGYRTWLAGLTILGMTVLWLGPWLGLLSGSPAGIAAGVALFATVLPAWAFARRFRLSLLAALLVPFTLPIAPWALAASTWSTLRRGGVEWRGTFYPLEQLRSRT